MTRSCTTCWYAAPKRPAPDFGPGATFPACCLVHGERLGQCPAWEEHRPGLPSPTTRDVNMARQMYRLAEGRRA